MIDSAWTFITPAYVTTGVVLIALAVRALWLLQEAAQRARDEDAKT